MNTRLSYIKNWLKLASRANWSVAKMARLSCVSDNTLRRYFSRQMGENPSQWIAKQRLKAALRLLQKGFSIKETSAQLGFRHQTNFTRKFKKQAGQCPWDFVALYPIPTALLADGGK